MMTPELKALKSQLLKLDDLIDRRNDELLTERAQRLNAGELLMMVDVQSKCYDLRERLVKRIAEQKEAA